MPETQHVRANKLYNLRKVQVRIDQLRATMQETAMASALFNINNAMAEYEEASLIAKDDRNPAAMNSATTGKTKVAGLFEKDQDSLL